MPKYIDSMRPSKGLFQMVIMAFAYYFILTGMWWADRGVKTRDGKTKVYNGNCFK